MITKPLIQSDKKIQCSKINVCCFPSVFGQTNLKNATMKLQLSLKMSIFTSKLLLSLILNLPKRKNILMFWIVFEQNASLHLIPVLCCFVLRARQSFQRPVMNRGPWVSPAGTWQ